MRGRVNTCIPVTPVSVSDVYVSGKHLLLCIIPDKKTAKPPNILAVLYDMYIFALCTANDPQKELINSITLFTALVREI